MKFPSLHTHIELLTPRLATQRREACVKHRRVGLPPGVQVMPEQGGPPHGLHPHLQLGEHRPPASRDVCQLNTVNDILIIKV